MRILHLITTMDRGGAETQLMQLAQFQQSKGIEVEICYFKGKGSLVSVAREVKIYELPGQVFAIQIFFLLSLLRRRKFDVVNAHLPRSEIASAFTTRLLRQKLVVTKHNTERFWPGGPQLISKSLALYVENSASATICITQAVKDYLRNIGECRNSRYFVVHYGIKSRKAKYITRSNFRKNEGELKVVCLARLEPQKNLIALIKLIPRILDLNPVLEIFGVGSQEHYLSSQIERYGLSSRIKLRGLTSSPYAEFESADLMILPSAYEGFGLVLLEALNAGCPVVASRIPAVIEVLGEMYPYLFNPNSKSELEQRVRGIVLSERAWLDDYRDKTLEKFSLEKQFNKTTEIYGLCMNDK